MKYKKDEREFRNTTLNPEPAMTVPSAWAYKEGSVQGAYLVTKPWGTAVPSSVDWLF